MDKLTEIGMRFIRQNENDLRIFARIQIAKGGIEDDHWVDYYMPTKRIAIKGDLQEECIDINIWRDDETQKWKATAYPMEYVRARGKEHEIQTNTGDYLELF